MTQFALADGGSSPSPLTTRQRGKTKTSRQTATGSEIYEAKCRCHGAGGQGGRAPVLSAVASRPDAELTKTIHDGHGKMPSFAGQLSDAQISKVVAYLKQLKPSK